MGNVFSYLKEKYLGNQLLIFATFLLVSIISTFIIPSRLESRNQFYFPFRDSSLCDPNILPRISHSFLSASRARDWWYRNTIRARENPWERRTSTDDPVSHEGQVNNRSGILLTLSSHRSFRATSPSNVSRALKDSRIVVLVDYLIPRCSGFIRRWARISEHAAVRHERPDHSKDRRRLPLPSSSPRLYRRPRSPRRRPAAIPIFCGRGRRSSRGPHPADRPFLPMPSHGRR